MSTMEVDGQDYCYIKKQGGEALPNFEHLFESYDPMDIFQWELSIQMWAHGATLLTTIKEVGNKTKTLLMKLQRAHGKLNFEMFNEKYKCIKLETFPKKAKEIGHLTGTNQKAVHHLGYQDNINYLLDKSLNNLEEEEQEEYLATYGTNMEDTVYDIQICTGNLNVM
eukprot:9332481-Ditylum_brightwellii.AAC.1